jgi:hypothetical protein
MSDTQLPEPAADGTADAADAATLRARIFGGDSLAEHRADRAERAARQVDLAQEEHIRANEDPVLREHIAAARRDLEKFESERALRPSLPALRGDYLAMMRNLNVVMRGLEERHHEELEAIEHAHRLSKAITGAATGRPIRNFSSFGPKAVAEAETRRAASELAKAAAATAGKYEELNGALSEFRQEIFVLRREAEKVCDGLLAFAEDADSERRRARELAAVMTERERARAAAEADAL